MPATIDMSIQKEDKRPRVLDLSVFIYGNKVEIEKKFSLQAPTASPYLHLPSPTLIL